MTRGFADLVDALPLPPAQGRAKPLQPHAFDYPNASGVEDVLARSIQAHLTDAEEVQRQETLAQFLSAIVAAIGVYHPDFDVPAARGYLRSGVEYVLGLYESDARTWIVVYHGEQKTRVPVECLLEHPRTRIVNAADVAQAVIAAVVKGPTPGVLPGDWIDVTAEFS